MNPPKQPCRTCGKPMPKQSDPSDPMQPDRCRRCRADAQPGDNVWGPTDLHTGEQHFQASEIGFNFDSDARP